MAMTEEVEREIRSLMTGADFDLDKLRALMRRAILQQFRDNLNPPPHPRWVRRRLVPQADPET